MFPRGISGTFEHQRRKVLINLSREYLNLRFQYGMNELRIFKVVGFSEHSFQIQLLKTIEDYRSHLVG